MTREIPLTRGMTTLVDDGDYESLATFKWHAIGKPARGFYAARVDFSAGRSAPRHEPMQSRILTPPPGMLVDHINGNSLDNRRGNLRLATYEQNARNRRSERMRRGDLKGICSSYVSSCGTVVRWMAYIYAGELGPRGYPKRIHLGCFSSEEEAGLAYDTAARKHFGEFARCNFQLGTTLEQAIEARAFIKQAGSR